MQMKCDRCAREDAAHAVVVWHEPVVVEWGETKFTGLCGQCAGKLLEWIGRAHEDRRSKAAAGQVGTRSGA